MRGKRGWKKNDAGKKSTSKAKRHRKSKGKEEE